jgi:hypothetical protein
MDRMCILSRLDAQAARVLALALPPGWTTHNVVSIRQLEREAQSGAFNVVVLHALDETLRERCAGAPRSHGRCLHRRLCLPLVLFSPLSVEALDAVVAIAHHCRVGVIYRLPDDRIERAHDAIARAAAARLGVRVLHALERAARAPLSGDIAQTVEHMFWEPGAFRRTGPALSTQGINGAALNAELRRAGLEPLLVLRRIARVAHAYQLVAEFDASLKDVARRVGAGSVDSLARETKLLTKLTPAQMCSRLRAEELADIAVRAGCSPSRRRPDTMEVM